MLHYVERARALLLMTVSVWCRGQVGLLCAVAVACVRRRCECWAELGGWSMRMGWVWVLCCCDSAT